MSLHLHTFIKNLDINNEHSIENYKEYFGDIYNIESARLLEKIALIYKSRKDTAAYADSIGIAIKILKT